MSVTSELPEDIKARANERASERAAASRDLYILQPVHIFSRANTIANGVDDLVLMKGSECKRPLSLAIRVSSLMV